MEVFPEDFFAFGLENGYVVVHVFKNELKLLMGFYPKPHFIFWLEPKNEAKKFKTAPASLEKLVVCRLKTFKLNSTKYVDSQTEKFFKRLLHSIFRLTGRGRSFASSVQNLFGICIENHRFYKGSA